MTVGAQHLIVIVSFTKEGNNLVIQSPVKHEQNIDTLTVMREKNKKNSKDIDQKKCTCYFKLQGQNLSLKNTRCSSRIIDTLVYSDVKPDCEVRHRRWKLTTIKSRVEPCKLIPILWNQTYKINQMHRSQITEMNMTKFMNLRTKG